MDSVVPRWRQGKISRRLCLAKHSKDKRGGTEYVNFNLEFSQAWMGPKIKGPAKIESEFIKKELGA